MDVYGAEQFVFRALFFEAENLAESVSHTVSWVINKSALNGTTGLFDYAVITVQESTTSTASKKSKTGAIVGALVGVIGGLTVLAAIILILLLRRKRPTSAISEDSGPRVRRVRGNYVVQSFAECLSSLPSPTGLIGYYRCDDVSNDRTGFTQNTAHSFDDDGICQGTVPGVKITKKMRGNLSNLTGHLQRRFPAHFRLCEVLNKRGGSPTTEEIQIANGKKAMDTVTAKKYLQELDNISHNIKFMLEQQMDKSREPWKQKEFDELIVKWIAACDQPFSTVEEPEFRAMLEYAYYHRSSEALKIPNRRNVREAIMTMHTDMVNGFKAMFDVSFSWTFF
ncbi:hypothetical protein B0H14DRAFT_2560359 [Mycena olivaceomarginata]|nr:hypothetical protein B0H14DRAFT_2560359 [Mycena olivaceomarginata]